jgi:hypothetical protein
MLQQDAAAILRSACELQHLLLFASGQPHEVPEIRRYAHFLQDYVEDTRRRMKQLEFELGHVRQDRDRLRARLDDLANRLEDMERTLREIDDALWPQ